MVVQKLVFGIVSRFLAISCDAFILSVRIDIIIENILRISRYRYHAIYIYNKKEKETVKEGKQKPEQNNHAFS